MADNRSARLFVAGRVLGSAKVYYFGMLGERRRSRGRLHDGERYKQFQFHERPRLSLTGPMEAAIPHCTAHALLQRAVLYSCW